VTENGSHVNKSVYTSKASKDDQMANEDHTNKDFLMKAWESYDVGTEAVTAVIEYFEASATFVVGSQPIASAAESINTKITMRLLCKTMH
jgi:hypothetical protein